MSLEDNKALVRRYLSHDTNQVRRYKAGGDEYHSPKFKIHGPSGDMNLRQYLEGMVAIATALPDQKCECDDLVAEGDKVIGRYHFTGTHQSALFGIAPSGKRVRVEGIAIYRIDGGKLVECWYVSDALGLMQQIGAIPSATPKK